MSRNRQTQHSQHTTYEGGQSASIGDTLRETAEGAAEAVRDAAGRARQSASGLYERAGEHYDRYGRRTGQSFRGARSSTEQFIQENPVLVGVIGLAAGLLLGSLLPRTRQEDRVFGQWADEVRDQGMRYARDVTQRGREIVEDTLSEVAEAARHAAEGQADQADRPSPGGQAAPAMGAPQGAGGTSTPPTTGAPSAASMGGAASQAASTGREGPSGRHQNT